MTNQRAAEVLREARIDAQRNLEDYYEIGRTPDEIRARIEAIDLAIRALSAPGEAVAWGAWAEGDPTRLLRYDGQPAVSHTPTAFYNAPLYTQPAASDAVVDEAMVDRARNAFLLQRIDPDSTVNSCWRAALLAALAPTNSAPIGSKSVDAALAPGQASVRTREWLEDASEDAWKAAQAGGVRVPREPTEAMLAVMDERNPPFGPPEKLTEDYCTNWRNRQRRSAAEIYAAMLAAAPQDGGA